MKKNIAKLLNYWLPPIIWAIVIFLLSSRKLPDVTGVYWQEYVFKKTSHVLFYGFHAILLYRALRGSKVSVKKATVWAAVVAIVYGITDEFHQSFVPGREPRLRDIGFDSFGILLALYAIRVFLPKSPNSVKSWARKLEII